MAGEGRQNARSGQQAAPDPFGGGRSGAWVNREPAFDLAGLYRGRPYSPSLEFQVGGQWYRQVDNGRECVLQPIPDPRVSPAELADRRRAVGRVTYLEDHPLGAVGYTGAAVAGGSQQARDRAMVLGGTVDTVMQASAPFGMRTRTPVKAPPVRVQGEHTPRELYRYRELNENGQASGATATIIKSELGKGGRVNQRVRPVGMARNGNESRQDRGHAIGRQLGGRADDARQMMPLDQWVNRSPMKVFENKVARRVRDGEVIEYSVTPFYNSPDGPPSSILLTAYGSRGEILPTLIRNPPPRVR